MQCIEFQNWNLQNKFEAIQSQEKKKITNQKQKDKENSNRCNRHMKEEKKKRIIIFFGDILGILFLISETLNQTLNKPPIKKINFFL